MGSIPIKPTNFKVEQRTYFDFWYMSLILIYMRKSKYDWNEVQKFYDNNHTWRETSDEFGVAMAAMHKALKRGAFKSRNKSDANSLSHKQGRHPKHTVETKKKISDARIKYLTEHPDKVPYLVNHSSNKSYPEKVFEAALISSGIIGWKSRFQNGIYQYDFAFPEQKIDVEVDGGTHTLEKVKRIDARRDLFSQSQGWKVIRFAASRVKIDVVGCINELKTILT